MSPTSPRCPVLGGTEQINAGLPCEKSDPSYPGGIGAQKTYDKEVLRTETPPFPLPGGDGWSQPLCTVPRIQREHQGGVRKGDTETEGRTLDKAEDGEENGDCDGGVPDAGRRGTYGEDGGSSNWKTEQSKGTESKLRPRSEKSVASPGVWHIPTGHGRREERGLRTVL
ncbi:hypothetical protein NDU88_005489 [Pleurodeles waltl]|uniref:Uncharacterized protein n=1 Tax=Pleurodeles waltl TaxID=8319 RepID=A0AAV7PKI4_PLEWA|nr:hypothetical protein NDU88_005489 [Pleurodeles waltl]